MKYMKPEVASLGPATTAISDFVIYFTKHDLGSDAGPNTQVDPAYDLDE